MVDGKSMDRARSTPDSSFRASRCTYVRTYAFSERQLWSLAIRAVRTETLRRIGSTRNVRNLLLSILRYRYSLPSKPLVEKTLHTCTRTMCVHTYPCTDGSVRTYTRTRTRTKERNNVHKTVADESRKFTGMYFIDDLRITYANVPAR